MNAPRFRFSSESACAVRRILWRACGSRAPGWLLTPTLDQIYPHLASLSGAILGESPTPGAWSPRGRSADKWTAAVKEEGRR